MTGSNAPREDSALRETQPDRWITIVDCLILQLEGF